MNELKELINEKIWYIWGLIVITLFRDAISGGISGLMMFIGNELNVDDEVFISGRPARVTRKGIFSTIFFMRDSRCKMRAPNVKLKDLTIEKKMPEGDKIHIKESK